MSRPPPPLLEGSRLACLSVLLGGTGATLATCLGTLTPLQAGALYLAFASLITFALFAWDKRRARTGKRRVSEANLLWLACLGGGAGAWLAMRMLRHKTRTQPFLWIVPIACVLQLVALAAIPLSPLWSQNV